MGDCLYVTFADGKYTIFEKENGGLAFLRHGLPWHAADKESTYSGMIRAAAKEIESLRGTNDRLSKENKCLCNLIREFSESHKATQALRVRHTQEHMDLLARSDSAIREINKYVQKREKSDG